MRRLYRSRRDRVAAQLTKRLPDCRISGVAAGLHILLTLPRHVSAEAVRAAVADRMRVMDLQVCRLGPSPAGLNGTSLFDEEGLVLGYGNLADDEIDQAVELLEAAIRGSAAAGKRPIRRGPANLAPPP
jgi:GntR family transcriptional regulator / MocR family aminotransferase